MIADGSPSLRLTQAGPGMPHHGVLDPGQQVGGELPPLPVQLHVQRRSTERNEPAVGEGGFGLVLGEHPPPHPQQHRGGEVVRRRHMVAWGQPRVDVERGQIAGLEIIAAIEEWVAPAQ